MSLTIQQILSDAKRLASRLKEHDTAADVLLSQTQSVYKQLDAMKQYQEDVNELNEVARQRPHAALAAGIQQENRHLRKLQQENRELRAALEEYQNALELIMSKYRQQTDTLIRQNQVDLSRVCQTSDIDKVHKQAEKISEMAAVMNQVAVMDEESSVRDLESMSQLITENRGLREMLQISRGSFNAAQQEAQRDEVKAVPNDSSYKAAQLNPDCALESAEQKDPQD
ncbi:FGFR1 oncogene partner 2 homolog [Thrips palmi]|uniref:FGFR1 oncogene partner 2 homolog n=1 Tax=Thrips palmi TaxID=161013 RepID=A0A6P8ZVS7_THRPL|nr:FGFR1 oncogene partner 2 homolog [Thrips palmi]